MKTATRVHPKTPHNVTQRLVLSRPQLRELGRGETLLLRWGTNILGHALVVEVSAAAPTSKVRT